MRTLHRRKRGSAATPGGTSPRRVAQLDFLRAVAILLVIGRHLQLERPDGVIGGLAEAWYRLGWIGVDLFFVLSGFLIGGLLITETRTHGRLDVKRFLTRRGFKIYPAYFAFLAYVILAPVVKAALNGGAVVPELKEQIGLSWPHLLFIQNYIEVSTAQHLWSIGVEEHFYLLLPLVVALLGATHARKLIGIGVVGLAVFLGLRLLSVATDDPFSTFMTATHLRLDALLFGVTLRAVMEYYPERFAGARRWRAPLVLFGIACWAPNLIVAPEAVWTRTVGLSLTLLGSAAFLIALFASEADDLGRARPVLEPPIRVLCWVGVFSYAIYLWHIAATGAFENLTERIVMPWAGDGQLGWLISAAIVCVGILAVGIVASVVVERPMLRIHERVAPSRASALPTAATAATEGARPVAARVEPESGAPPIKGGLRARLAGGTAPSGPGTG